MRLAAQGTNPTNVRHDGSSVDGMPPAVGATAGAERMRKRKRRMYNVANITVRDLAARPDLANVGALLRLAAHRHVRVTTRTSIQARFDCGTSVRQHLRATEEYLGAPWYDAVLYHPGGDESRVCVGELRAIVRGPAGDAVVLVAMESVPSEHLFPFVSRWCVRLKWRIGEGAYDVTLRLVPVDHDKRLSFVVPDFADLAASCGVTEDLLSMERPLQERLDMRYFLNVFFPWDDVVGRGRCVGGIGGTRSSWPPRGGLVGSDRGHRRAASDGGGNTQGAPFPLPRNGHRRRSERTTRQGRSQPHWSRGRRGLRPHAHAEPCVLCPPVPRRPVVLAADAAEAAAPLPVRAASDVRQYALP